MVQHSFASPVLLALPSLLIAILAVFGSSCSSWRGEERRSDTGAAWLSGHRHLGRQALRPGSSRSR
eukprot:16432055-Heterocapsa_arctica.AAC.1